MKTILILGGGYGGHTVATELLDSYPDENTSVVLVDRMPYQGLKTEYYALVSGSVADVALRLPFPSDSRLTIKYGEITEIDLAAKNVRLNGNETLPYDQLVIALGCTDHYHGIPGADLYSQSIQTFSGARKAFQAINDTKPYGQISIVGGGLSGVELAAELRETREDLNIRIIDRGESVLSSFPEKLRAYVREWFIEHDVALCPSISLARVEPETLYCERKTFATDATVWTAGIRPNPLVQKLNLEKDPQGRVKLNPLHQTLAYPEVYVVGDCASLPHSPSAQAAEAQGKQVASVIKALAAGETPQLPKITLKGTLGSLGKNSGFGLMGKQTVMLGIMPRILKSGVLWMSKHHFG